MNRATKYKVQNAALYTVAIVWGALIVGVPILVIAALVKFVFYT